MRRREFIAGLGSAAAWPVAAPAQQPERMRRIGVLMVFRGDDAEASSATAAFEQGLERFGWVIGRNIQVDYHWGVNEINKLQVAITEILSNSPDVIVPTGALALAAVQKATSVVPIVFIAATEPVAQGLIASLAHPGGNTTGFTNLEPTVYSKWLQVLKLIAPHITHVAIMYNPETAPYLVSFSDAVLSAAATMGIEAIVTPVKADADVEATIGRIAAEPGWGLIVPPDVFTSGRHKMIADLSIRFRLPAIHQYRFFAAEGGLMSYGLDVNDLYRRSGSYIDRVLRGEKPANLAVQQPTKFFLVFNLKTAKALGLTIPETLLATADEVIQ
jgi:putative tryptophan/tyrosine transport system substrate-binding protein